jgi:hypothetical protein
MNYEPRSTVASKYAKLGISVRCANTERVERPLRGSWSLRSGRGDGGGDDAADFFRYLVATKTRSVLTRKL